MESKPNNIADHEEIIEIQAKKENVFEDKEEQIKETKNPKSLEIKEDMFKGLDLERTKMIQNFDE